MLQGEKIPSRVDAGDGNGQQVDAGRNGMPRVVGEMRDCGGMEGVGVGWLAANENARQLRAVSARS